MPDSGIIQRAFEYFTIHVWNDYKLFCKHKHFNDKWNSKNSSESVQGFSLETFNGSLAAFADKVGKFVTKWGKLLVTHSSTTLP